MVAGAIPSFDQDADNTIVSIVGAILQDTRLHVLSARGGDHVFYLAVASKWVSHTKHFHTALAAALPGHPEHRGNAIYAIQIGKSMVAAVKQDADLFIVNEDAATLNGMAQDSLLPLLVLPSDAKSWPLESNFSRQRNSIERITGKVARLSTYVLAACILLYLIMSGAEEYLKRNSKQLARSDATADLIRDFQYTSPLSEQLAHFQLISATVVRAGGWIDGYIWKPGKEEAFEIIMPGWISQDYIEALGAGTVAEYNIPDNLVIARKGTLRSVDKP